MISIATIKHNLSTPLGLYPPQMLKGLYDYFMDLNNALEGKNCSGIIKSFKDLRVKNVISYKNSCDLLKNCNLNLESEGNYSCLFTI